MLCIGCNIVSQLICHAPTCGCLLPEAVGGCFDAWTASKEDYKGPHAALIDRAAVASVLLFQHDYRVSLALLLCSQLRNKKKMQGW